MSRHQKDPLRPLTADERKELTRLSRSPSAPAAQGERARALLAIAEGASYTAAAHQIGRRHTETLSAWVRGPVERDHDFSSKVIIISGST